MISFFSQKIKNKAGTHLDYFLESVTPEELFDLNAPLIKRLKLAYSDAGSWDDYFLPCLKQLALCCGHLPYSPNGIFSEADGIFKASVSAATYAIEVMESSVQLEKNIMAQHLLQGRLKAACALAGLCAFLDVFINRLQIVQKPKDNNHFFNLSESNHVSQLAFDPLAQPYIEWINEKLGNNPNLELELRWNGSTEPISQIRQNQRLFLARHILVSKTLSWLAQAGKLPLVELMKCLTTDNDIENLPSSVVKARDLGVYRACLLERERMGQKLGELLAPEGWQETLIRILRTRILNDWPINAKDSPLRKGADGLFLFWPDVCPILIDDMKHFGLTELPTDPDLWAGCLLSSGITLPSKKGNPTCLIAVTPNAKPREAIKLSDTYFFTSGTVLHAKTIKRDFETELNLDQTLALSQLTRDILEASNKVFTNKLPLTIQAQQTLIWHLSESIEQPELEEALSAYLNHLTENPSFASEVLLDEGLFITNLLANFAKEASFERLVTGLLTSNLIYQTDRNEPLWATHADHQGINQRGIILKPELIEGSLYETKLTFKDLFEYIHKRKPTPQFHFKGKQATDVDQLSLDFDQEALHG